MQAEVVIEVPFHDVDIMNVVWHGHYLKYFEIARCKLLDQFHYNYMQMQASGYAWPVIESHVRYVQGIQFEHKTILLKNKKHSVLQKLFLKIYSQLVHVEIMENFATDQKPIT